MAAVVDADIYVLTDGDDTYPAKSAPAMIERLQHDQLEMLVGTRLERFDTGSFRAFHWFGNRVISGLIALLFRTKLTDVLSGYRVLSRSFINIVRLRHGGFEVETEMTLQALAKRLSVGEMAIEYRERPPESFSKLNTWSDGLLILKCILLLFKDYKPLLFFTATAFVLGLASLASGSAPIIDFIQNRYVLHVPRAILAAALAILSILCFGIGVILDTIAKFHEETIELWKRHLKSGH